MLIYVQFGIIYNLQMSPIPQTSFLVWTFLEVSYSKPALGLKSLEPIIISSLLKGNYL